MADTETVAIEVNRVLLGRLRAMLTSLGLEATDDRVVWALEKGATEMLARHDARRALSWPVPLPADAVMAGAASQEAPTTPMRANAAGVGLSQLAREAQRLEVKAPGSPGDEARYRRRLASIVAQLAERMSDEANGKPRED